MTVDEILATGKYTDRRGRAWNYDPDFDVWVEYSSRDDGILHLGWIVDTKDVRLLIERDMHRDECEGLDGCLDHPVPIVYQDFNEDGATAWGVVGAHRCNGLIFDVPHAHAMNMARALAVGE